MITRCPSCRTVFKVVPDQLRIAAGWVRCGHCGELFDGQAQLIPPPPLRGVAAGDDAVPGSGAGSTRSSAPREAPPCSPDWPLNPDDIGIEPDFQPTTLLVLRERLAGASTPSAGIRADDTNPAEGEEAVDIPSEPAPALRAASVAAPDPMLDDVPAFLDARNEPQLRAGAANADYPFAAPVPTIRIEVDPRPASDTAALDPYPFAAPRVAPPEHGTPHAPDIPSFIRRAQAHPFWDHAATRAVLWAALVLLLIALAAQWLRQERDWLVARFPALRDVTTVLCQPLGCTVQPYRMLDAIAIDGSDFKALDGHTFRFDLSVRNNADLAVAMPSFQLTLSNGQGQVLVRRVIDAVELEAPATLKAHGEFDTTRALRISSTAQPDSITSYRVIAFYR